MAKRRAFRPDSLDARDQLEPRVVPSHLGVAGHHVRHPSHSHLQGKGHVGRNRAAVLRGEFLTSAFQTASASVAPPAAVVPAPAPVVAPTLGPATGAMTAEEQRIAELVNQERAQAGLAPLQTHPRLVEAAQIHSNDMARLGRMDHTLPGAALPTLPSRMQAVDYPVSYVGENIASGFADANAVVTGWMNSAGHRANILNPNFTGTGVGIARDVLGAPYYTQDFGRAS